MGQDKNYNSVYSNKVYAGHKRTYYFDVRETKGDDYYITITEKTRRNDGNGFDRHKIFLYKEDFNRFLNQLEDAVDHIKQELLPEYDYDEFAQIAKERKQKIKQRQIEQKIDEESEDEIDW